VKRAITIAAMLAAAGLAGAQMFAQLFGTTGTPIPAVAWYKLDGNALDSSGNGYNGTWGGSPTYVAGVFDGSQAASLLRGRWVDTGYDFADAGYLFAGSGVAWTVAWWQRSTNQVSVSINYSPNGSSTAAKNLQAYMHTASTQYTPRLFVRGVNTGTSALANDSVWHHLAVRWDGSVATLIKDGATAYALNVGTTTNVVGTLFLGNSNAYGDAVAPLSIDDVRVYNRAISVENLARIMESQDNEPLEELQ